MQLSSTVKTCGFAASHRRCYEDKTTIFEMNETQPTFDELFSTLIQESENTIIEYKHHYSYYKDDCAIRFSLESVNGCKNDYEFKKKLQSKCRESLKKLGLILSQISDDIRFEYLDDIKDNLDSLLSYVENDTDVIEENEHGPREEHHFKSFINPKYKGTCDDKLSYYKTSIARSASSFAEAWIEVLVETKSKVDFFINQLDLIPGISTDKTDEYEFDYVDSQRLLELKSISSELYDLTKLVRLCEELNKSYESKSYYSVVMLVRAIIDHVPPIFNVNSFSTLIANHGTKSFKDSMNHLNNSLRKIADASLHVQIRNSEVLPNSTQVNFVNDLDVLLSEVVRILKR